VPASHVGLRGFEYLPDQFRLFGKACTLLRTDFIFFARNRYHLRRNLCGSKAARKSKCAEDERTFYKLPHTSSIWKFELFAPVLGGPVELKFQLSALSFFGIAKPAGRSARDEER